MKALLLRQRWVGVLLFLAILAGPPLVLAAGSGAEAEKAASAPETEFSLTGTVVHVGVEGGFWGIIGDDGKHYDVSNLPEEFRHQDLRVRLTGKQRPDQASTHMWGIMIEMIAIEMIGGAGK